MTKHGTFGKAPDTKKSTNAARKEVMPRTQIELSPKAMTALFDELGTLTDDPKAFADRIKEFGFKQHQHRTKTAYYRLIAHTQGIVRKVEQSKNRDAIVARLAELSAGSKSKELTTLVLRAFIDYDDKDGAARAARDKAVSLYLALKKIEPREAAKFIKKKGGLVNCATLYRRALKKERGNVGEEPAKPALRRLSSLFSNELKKKGDTALVVLRLEGNKAANFSVVGALPIGMPENKFSNEWIKSVSSKLFDRIHIAREQRAEEEGRNAW